MMAPVPPKSPTRTEAMYHIENAFDDLLHMILEALADTDAFSHCDSPSIFIVYAHDNPKEGTSNAWCVQHFINWLRIIRSRTLSDKSPLPLLSSRDNGSDSARNILDNQFCLLPSSDNSLRDRNRIGSVDKVLLHGSEVLKQYYKNESTASYIQSIKEAYNQWRDKSSDVLMLKREIRKLVEAECQSDEFHHLFTEYALLEIRASEDPANHGIIPVALHDDLMDYLPFRDKCDLVFKLKSPQKVDLHKLFFKLLSQVYVEEHVLITQFLRCYEQSSKRLLDLAVLSPQTSHGIINQEILAAQRALKDIGSAAFRSQRLDHEREYQRKTAHDIHNMSSRFDTLIDDTRYMRTKVENKKLQDVLQWLSTCPFRLHHQSVSSVLTSGSGSWLIGHHTYRDWLGLMSPATLLIHGVRGCGKSAIFSIAVDQLLSEDHKWRTAYHYCANITSEPDRASPIAILRSITRQLAVDHKNSTIATGALVMYEKLAACAGPDQAVLQRLDIESCLSLIMEMTGSTPTYIAIDAIDELQEENRFVLIEALRQLMAGSGGTVKVLLTSRSDTQIESLLHNAMKIRVSPEENKHDVDIFINTQLEVAVRGRILLNGVVSDVLMKTIRDSLVAGAGEMFLWVRLQVQDLCRKKTEHDLFTALQKGLVGELDKIYNKTYEAFLAMDKFAQAIVRGVFSWILFSRTPFTLEALRSALLMSPDLPAGSNDMTLPDLEQICHNLVMIDPVTNTLRACHSSVIDYMLRKPMFSAEAGNRLLADSCIQECIMPSGSQSRFSEVSLATDFSMYAALYWPEHLGASETSDSTSNHTSQPLYDFVFGASGSGRPSLAFMMWLEWVKEVCQMLPTYHALKRALETLGSPDGPSPIFTASVFGLCDLLDIVLSNMDELDLERHSDTGHTPMYLACAFGHGDVVARLLEHHADVNVRCGSFGSPLQVACFRGHYEVVEILMAQGVSSTNFRGAFEAACDGGRERVALMLIKKGLALDNNDYYDQALQNATEAGFRDVVEYLMTDSVARTFGQDVGNKDYAGPIVEAIKAGQVSILRSFLHSRPHVAGMIPADAMATAALHGQEEMLSFLHDRGMDIEAEGKFGSALRSACLIGDKRCVGKLLDWGADVKALGQRGDCLQAAAKNGHVPVMRLLISAGAQVNQKGKPFGTCIQAAAYYGHTAAVAFLLEEGAKMYAAGKFPDALHAAVKGGHEHVASMLLEKGYTPQAKRELPGIARGEHRSERPWFMDGGFGDKQKLSGRSRSPVLDDEEFDDSDTSVVSTEDSPQHDEGGSDYGLVSAAAFGNIPILRQFLQPLSVDEKEIREALKAAAAKGQIAALETLMVHGMRHMSKPRAAAETALIAAATHGQVKCMVNLAAWLNRSVGTGTWTAVLKSAASGGHQGAVAETITLERLTVASSMPQDDDLDSEPDNLYEYEDFDDSDDPETPEWNKNADILESCADAIEAASSAGHQDISKVLWDWILQDGKLSRGTDALDWMAVSKVAASFADVATVEMCLRRQQGSMSQGIAFASSYQELLSAAGKKHNTATFEYLFEIIQTANDATTDMCPTFIQACEDGFERGALKLARHNNKTFLTNNQIAQGMGAASRAGHANLVVSLIATLKSRRIGSKTLVSMVEKALLSGAAAGSLGVVQAILQATRIRDQSPSIITRALVTACELGQHEMALFCLNEGAEVDLSVPRAPPSLFPAQPRVLLRQRRPVLIDYRPSSESVQWTNALKASVDGLPHISPGHETMRFRCDMDQEKRQEFLVRLMLEHGCDPNRCDQGDEYPLQTAVQRGNSGIVQALVEAGATIDALEGSTNLLKFATRRRSAEMFRIVLLLLKAGERIPMSSRGTLDADFGEMLNMAHTSTTFPERDILSKRQQYITSREVARQVMNSGLRELIMITFNKQPQLVALQSVFGNILHLAAAAGDLATIKRLIKHDVNLGYTMSYGHSALGTAAEFGNIQVMTALIDAGAALHPKQTEQHTRDGYGLQEPLTKAILGGQPAAVRLLLDKRADPTLHAGSSSLLLIAAESRNSEIVRSLLAAGMNANSDGRALVTAAYNGDLSIVKCLLEHKGSANALAIYGDTFSERQLCNPLYVACERGHVEIVQELLNFGADIDIDVGDHFGLPLVAAAGHGRTKIVEILLGKGCDPTQRSKGFEAVPKKYRAQARELQEARELYLSYAPQTRGGGSTAGLDISKIKAQLAASRSQDAAYPNAILSACNNATGMQNTRTTLGILFANIEILDERQAACLEALEHTAETQNHGVFECLLGYSASLDSGILGLACKCGSLTAVERILSSGVTVHMTGPGDLPPLLVAIAHMHAELTEVLLSNGATPQDDEQTGPTSSCYALCAFALDSFIATATSRGKSITECETIVRRLVHIAKGVHANATVYQAELDASLRLACHVGSVEIAALFLEAGAKTDSQLTLPWMKQNSTDSALFTAIDHNAAQVLPLLFNWSADPNQTRVIITDGQGDSDSGWETVTDSSSVVEFNGTQEQGRDSPGPEDDEDLQRSLQTALDACLGKDSPLLLQTFLRVTKAVEITELHLTAAAQNPFISRAPGESDLEIILAHDEGLSVSEEVVLALRKTLSFAQGYPAASRRFFWQVLERSTCGVTKSMLQTIPDPNLLKVMHKFCKMHQSNHFGTDSENANAERPRYPLMDQSMEFELQQALERVEDPQEHFTRPVTVADLQRTGGFFVRR